MLGLGNVAVGGQVEGGDARESSGAAAQGEGGGGDGVTVEQRGLHALWGGVWSRAFMNIDHRNIGYGCLELLLVPQRHGGSRWSHWGGDDSGLRRAGVQQVHDWV